MPNPIFNVAYIFTDIPTHPLSQEMEMLAKCGVILAKAIVIDGSTALQVDVRYPPPSPPPPPPRYKKSHFLYRKYITVRLL
jgi:hypothetical protein